VAVLWSLVEWCCGSGVEWCGVVWSGVEWCMVWSWVLILFLT